MAHVKIRLGNDPTGVDKRAASIVIDGVDITEHVLRDGFRVEAETLPGSTRGVVRFRFIADELDLDIPNAGVDATPVTPATDDSDQEDSDR